MGKVKESKGAKAANPLAAAKTSGIAKASQPLKAKAKESTKVVNKKVNVGSDVSSDESDDEVDSDSASGSESEDDSDDSDGSDEGDSEEESKNAKLPKPAAKGKVNGKANGKANGASHADSDASDDDSESNSDDGAKPKAKGAKTNGAAAADADSSDSSDSSDDEVEKKASNGKSKKKADGRGNQSDSADSEDDSDGSGSSDDSQSGSDAESESPKTPAKPQREDAAKKRKFEATDDSAFPKKAKMDNVEDEQSSTIFVGRLSWNVDDDMLFEVFKDFDGLLGARVVTYKDTGRSRGFGYVDFSSHTAAKTALDAMQGKDIDGRPVNLDLAKSRASNNESPQARAQDRAKRHSDVVSPPSETLFVGNIPFEATQDDVYEFFSDVAEVVSVRLPTDPETGNAKGFGYVTFNSVEDAQRVFQAKNGASIGPGRAGRVVRLDYATQRPPRDGNSGGDRGGRGGGRGGRGGRGGGRGSFGGGRGSFGGGRGGFGGGRGGGFRSSFDGGASSSNKIRFDD